MGSSASKSCQKGTRRNGKPKALSHYDYTIGWVSPLEVELIAALEMLDEEHTKLPQSPGDQNVYQLGSIAGHNIVIASLWQAGNSEAATVVAQMRMTFPNIRFGLLVGIGGGVPVKTEAGNIRLGDVVVSKPVGEYSGTLHYDGRRAMAGQLIRTGTLAPPPAALLAAAQSLEANRARKQYDPLIANIQRINTSIPTLSRFKFPGSDQDFLFSASYHHARATMSCLESRCDMGQRIPRNPSHGTQRILVHRGTIASGEVVVKSGEQRDHLGRQCGVLCFEMEAVGALGNFPCLVIRGISDYCDSHKNDQWHGFASASAAAYARELLFHLPLDRVKR